MTFYNNLVLSSTHKRHAQLFNVAIYYFQFFDRCKDQWYFRYFSTKAVFKYHTIIIITAEIEFLIPTNYQWFLQFRH